MTDRCRWYQVDWDDLDDDHRTRRNLTWREACTLYQRLDLIAGNQHVQISPQAGTS